METGSRRPSLWRRPSRDRAKWALVLKWALLLNALTAVVLVLYMILQMIPSASPNPAVAATQAYIARVAAAADCPDAVRDVIRDAAPQSASAPPLPDLAPDVEIL